MAVKKQKTLPELLKKAQEVFNKWIRTRDKNKGCAEPGRSIMQGITTHKDTIQP